MHSSHQTQRIQKLPPHVAERIAAGEIIERPSSIVKELIENALDADCTELAVFLEEGGKRLIEVWDNGSGISPKDLEICTQRHATSKLKSLEDLDHIQTLGFRGEALPSIAAVSELDLISRTAESDSAYSLCLGDWISRHPESPHLPQKMTFGQFLNSDHGTRIRAQGVFSQIPARLKFLKSQSAEVSHIRDTMERLSLAYPQVGFQLESDSRRILSLRPTTEINRVKSILSNEEDYPVLMADKEQDGFLDLGLKIRIYWLQGASSGHTKKLIQVVNARSIRDRLLQQAILAPFRQALMPGQFPSLALFIQINPAAIDVNVHPSKTEIRFLESQKIFRSVESLIKTLLSQNGSFSTIPPQQFSSFSNTQETIEPPEAISSMSSLYETPYKTPASSPSFSLSSQPPFQQKSFSLLATPAKASLNDNIELNFLEKNASPPEILKTARFLGILFHTYITYQNENELILIDQHAAHERVRYETLKKKLPHFSSKDLDTPLFPSQALLIPEVITFCLEQRPLIEEKLDKLTRLGFEAEIFGEDRLLFRAIPPIWGSQQLKIRLKNLIEKILEIMPPQENSPLFDEKLFEALASEACHSSIRAGDRLEPMEATALVNALFECEHPWNCPHGRPTIVKVPERKLEEWFQRK